MLNCFLISESVLFKGTKIKLERELFSITKSITAINLVSQMPRKLYYIRTLPFEGSFEEKKFNFKTFDRCQIYEP